MRWNSPVRLLFLSPAVAWALPFTVFPSVTGWTSPSLSSREGRGALGRRSLSSTRRASPSSNTWPAPHQHVVLRDQVATADFVGPSISPACWTIRRSPSDLGHRGVRPARGAGSSWRSAASWRSFSTKHCSAARPRAPSWSCRSSRPRSRSANCSSPSSTRRVGRSASSASPFYRTRVGRCSRSFWSTSGSGRRLLPRVPRRVAGGARRALRGGADRWRLEFGHAAAGAVAAPAADHPDRAAAASGGGAEAVRHPVRADRGGGRGS